MQSEEEILLKYPTLPRPKNRLPYEYKVSEEDKELIIPRLDVIFVLEQALDQIENGISLREATDFLNSRVPYDAKVSHMGLKKIRSRLRPDSIRAPVKRKPRMAPKIVKKDDSTRLEEKRKKLIANERRRITHAKKRIEKAEQELGIIKDNSKEAAKPYFELPSDHEIFQEVTLPEGINEEEVIFRPSARQLKFLAASELEVLYGGAAGGGKSYALLADAARYFEFPSFRGLLLRRTTEELKELVWESQVLYKKLYGNRAKFNAQDKMWTFPNGGTLWMSYLEQEKDVLRYQGQSYTWVGFDELTQHPTPFAWNYLRGRLRTKDEAMKPFLSMRATTNPGGPGHGWVKKMFIDPAPFDTRFPAHNLETNELMLVPEGDPDFPSERWGTPLFYRRFIPAKLVDNPYLSYEYKANLLSLPEGQRRQLLEGDWTLADGAAFPEFSRHLHVIEPFEIPNTWRKFRSCDFGYSQKSASAVHWYAVDPDGTLYVYRELYVKGMTARALSQKIKQLEAGETIAYGMLDSSCWHERGNSGPCIADEMIQAGTRWRPSDRTAGARKSGKNRLHELLKVDEYTGKPSILFFDTCRQIISDLEVIPVHPDGKDDTDDKYAEDHAYDSIRYGVLSRPRSASIFETFNYGVVKPSYRPVDSILGY